MVHAHVKDPNLPCRWCFSALCSTHIASSSCLTWLNFQLKGTRSTATEQTRWPVVYAHVKDPNLPGAVHFNLGTKHDYAMLGVGLMPRYQQSS